MGGYRVVEPRPKERVCFIVCSLILRPTTDHEYNTGHGTDYLALRPRQVSNQSPATTCGPLSREVSHVDPETY